MSKLPEKIIETLKKHKGVIKVESIDDDFIEEIKDEDLSVNTSFGMPIDNQALHNCFSRDYALCLYADYSFEHSNHSMMVMKDSLGNVIGHDVAECQMKEYQDKEDLIWISDNFVIYTNVSMDNDLRLVMTPQEYRGFSSDDGVLEATVFYPMPTTDCIIKKKYGNPNNSQIATVIMGIDLT